MSSCFEKPLVTPSTMLASSVRDKPCSALCLVSSLGRFTVMVPLSCEMSISAGMSRESSPLGPFTVTRLPSTVIVTPEGTVIGFFPMRDIIRVPLPDEREYLAAGARLARLAVRHQTLRRAQDRHAQAIADARDLRDSDVLAETGCRDALHLADDGLPALRVLEYDAKRLAAALLLESPVILNEVVVLQDSGDLDFHLGSRHVDTAMLRSAGVADASQHVGDRISHAHLISFPCPIVSN